MAHLSRRPWLLIFAASFVCLIVMAAIWAVAPDDVRAWLMVVGGVFYVVAIVGGYAIERRVHW
jgi:hypothetical protein